MYAQKHGTQLIKICLHGSDWLDPSTFRITFDVCNTNASVANKLRPIGGPWSFYSRMGILVGGQILEDIDVYNRVHEMFNDFTTEGSGYNDYAEGLGVVLEKWWCL